MTASCWVAILCSDMVSCSPLTSCDMADESSVITSQDFGRVSSVGCVPRLLSRNVTLRDHLSYLFHLTGDGSSITTDRAHAQLKAFGCLEHHCSVTCLGCVL